MNDYPEPVDAEGPRTGRLDPDRDPGSSPYRSIILIAAVLLAWAVLLAVGALWSGDHYRRAIVILVSMGCFLTVWATALWLKRRRG